MNQFLLASQRYPPSPRVARHFPGPDAGAATAGDSGWGWPRPWV
ncbi:MAG: hypothetical protein WCR07_11205 [Verrucomicrobiota bacterium]